MRGRFVLVLALLAGCGGTASLVGSADDPPDGGVASDAAIVDGWVSVDSAMPADSGQRMDSDATPGLDAGAVSDAQDASDAGFDADDGWVPFDAGYDAAVDSGSDSAPAVDAGYDAGPQPDCLAGQSRCDAFKYETCQDGKWSWYMGDQRCCSESGRWTNITNGPTTYEATDSTTGLRWQRGILGGPESGPPINVCSSYGYRNPTTAELSHLVIGPPENSISVCSPTIDHKTFPSATSDVVFTNDGCVDLLRGTSTVGACSRYGSYHVCVVP